MSRIVIAEIFTFSSSYQSELIIAYSGSQLSEVQEPHSQPPPRSSRACSDVPHLIKKSYIVFLQSGEPSG
ncbi:hypothetical protein [Nostoc sp.]|uniref:hypothetical protein n=1 Tax=Nostoc sp. TaxID=1180 RepID=UPI002FF7EF50